MSKCKMEFAKAISSNRCLDWNFVYIEWGVNHKIWWIKQNPINFIAWTHTRRCIIAFWSVERHSFKPILDSISKIRWKEAEYASHSVESNVAFSMRCLLKRNAFEMEWRGFSTYLIQSADSADSVAVFDGYVRKWISDWHASFSLFDVLKWFWKRLTSSLSVHVEYTSRNISSTWKRQKNKITWAP